jgi:outer membrane protein OmpA-like peptidoglycan-associated protein
MMKKLILTALLSASTLMANDLYTDTYMSRSGIVYPHIDTGIPNSINPDILMSKKIHFHASLYFDAEGLTLESQDNLKRLQDYMILHPVKNYYISIIGHTSGYEDSNHLVQLNEWSTFWQNLGKTSMSESQLAAQINRRIAAVYNYLHEKEGISKSRLYTENRLAKDPISTEATAEGKMRNRRVDIALYY